MPSSGTQEYMHIDQMHIDTHEIKVKNAILGVMGGNAQWKILWGTPGSFWLSASLVGVVAAFRDKVSWVWGYKALLLPRLVSRTVTLTPPANMVWMQNIRSYHKPHRSELGSLCLQGTSLSTRNFEIGHLKGPGGELGQAIGTNVTGIGAEDVVRG